jgi:hypothetical protein
MKAILTIFLAISVLFSACSPAEVEIKVPEKYTVIELDSSNQDLYENTTPTNLKFYEIQLVDSIIKYAIADHNQKAKDDYQKLLTYYPGMEDNEEGYILDFNDYYRQYIPYINERGEKVVHVNCFCDVTNMNGELSGRYWRTDLIQVNDGGNCFFSLYVNLTLETFAHLMVNGVG